MINIIVFSKDRGCQLELFLRSMKLYFNDFYEHKIKILYTYSNDNFKKGYEKIKQIHDDNNIMYIKETDSFKNHLLLLINPENKYTVFFVDDIIFKNTFSLNSIQFKLFTLNEDILTLSLRLQPNLTYCYPAKKRILKQPLFEKNYIFKWIGQDYDYNYPMSLDGHFFRTNEILALTKVLSFNNPNSYESILASYPLKKSKMICFENSIIMNNPINRVQTFNNNYHGNIDSNLLNEKFLDNYIIDLDIFKGFKNFGVHQEVEISFIKNENKS